jgi:serine protease AprX
MRSTLVLSSLVLVLAWGCGAPDTETDVDELASSRSAIVYLKARADLAPASRAATKEDRGRFVYTELTKTARSSQAGLLHDLAGMPGLKVRPFHIVNAVLVENASASVLRSIAARPDVSHVEPDVAVKLEDPGRLTPEEETESIDQGFATAVGDNITSTGAERVWNELGVKGEGIVIAGQDTGYDWTHPGLKAHYRGWDGTTADHRYNWHDSIHGSGSNPCGFDLRAPCDDQGHGTHTMGTMVGDDGGANKVGMAPGAKWIGCRNMNAGTGKPSSYLECWEWFLAPYPQGANPQTEGKPEMAPHVINNSWGCDGTEGCRGQEFVQVLQNLAAAGVYVVVSAGNSGAGCGTINAQPATISDTTLSVGAHNHRTGKIAGFSSRGPSSLDGKIGPDLTAPGMGIRSTTKGGNYGGNSGTSMAGPHVAGAAALLWSAVPALRGNIEATSRILTRSAKPTTSTQTCGGVPGTAIPNNTFGYGTLDIFNAITQAQTLTR